MELDESVSVEAAEGNGSLKFADEKQQARFELGVSMMVYKWDALDVAVANGWGGPDSREKRDWITAIVCDAFKAEKVIDAAYLEEMLLYAMVDEFDTNVEDDSALPIAVGIVNLYKQCAEQNYELVEQLYTAWQTKQQQHGETQNREVHIEEDPLNEGVSSSDDDEIEIEDTGMVEQEATAPVIDEDGFELVQKKGKRRH